MSRKALIVCNGDFADLSRVCKHIDKQTLVIACDGGATHALKARIIPDVVIGDFDSISKKTLHALKNRSIEYIHYPADKIYTDAELGLMLAKERGYRDIILTGIHGTNTDHLIANVALLAKKRYSNLALRIVDGREEMTLVRKRIVIRGKKNETVSLIAIGENTRGVTTKGLFYPLKNDVLKAWGTRGLRNHMTGARAEVTLKKGALLVIHHIARN